MTDFVRVPADSAGKRVNASIHNDGTNDISTQVFHLGDRLNPDLLQSVSEDGAAKVEFPNGAPDFDAFGRTSVSEPNLMGMFKFYHRDYADEFEKEEVGSGLVVLDTVLKGVRLTTSTLSGDVAGYHSHRFFHYRPGNSMSLTWTMKMGDAGKTGVSRRAGWITTTDGMYFEAIDNVIYATIHNGNLGTYDRTAITAWNGDRLDGSGGDLNLSGATLDPTASSIWWIDFQFLGAGAVRFGTYVDGIKVLCHTIGHYGELDRPYLSSSSLSFGAEQTNTGVTGTPSEMHVFCVVVTNDGYDEFDRRPISISNEKTITTTTLTPLLSFRPTASFHSVDNRARILPQSLSVLASGGDIEIVATASPSLTGATWGGSVSGTEYDTAASALTGGEVKIGNYIASGRSESIDLSSIFKINIDGVTRHYTPATSDHITISARLLSAGSATAAVSLNVIEIE